MPWNGRVAGSSNRHNTRVRSTRDTNILVLAAFWLVGPLLAAEPPSVWVWKLPPGMPEPHVPANNPMSEEKRALGQRLFFEPKLSISGGMACVDCHEPRRAFTDGRARSPGATGELTERGAMSLINVAYSPQLGWNKPKLRELEEQMLEPLFNEHPLEMGLKGREQAVVALLASRADYRKQFRLAFPDDAQPVNMTNVIRAIACYQRTLIQADSPFDRFLYLDDQTALSGAARRGMDLFFAQDIGCANCHSGVAFAGPWRDATGLSAPVSLADNGLGLFKVPTLRNVALTAPYMHDGRFATLGDVVAHYGQMARSSSGLRRDARLPQRVLSAAERDDLLAFLSALTDRAYATETAP